MEEVGGGTLNGTVEACSFARGELVEVGLELNFQERTGRGDQQIRRQRRASRRG